MRSGSARGRGEPISEAGLGKIVRRRTREWFGTAYGPHAFRKWLTSVAAEQAPAAAVDAAVVLSHSRTTSIRHYNKASPVAATLRHAARIRRLRRESLSLAASAYGWRARPEPDKLHDPEATMSRPLSARPTE